MFVEIAKQYQGDFPVFHPYGPAGDRSRWESLPQKLRRDLVESGERFLNYAYPLLPATKYMEYCRIGNRSMFEQIYFDRRRVLNSLIMAECVEHKGRFMDDIVNGLMAVCEESGWQLPAHNWTPNPDKAEMEEEVFHTRDGRVKGSEVHCLPDSEDPVMDLFSCETSAQVAMAVYLLGSELDAVSPVITRRVEAELRRRTLAPYLKKHFNWMGVSGQDVNNWTPWCTQNVLIAVFSMSGATREEKQATLEQAAKSLDIFLDVYGEDGCCNEGAGYYRAAGLCLFNALEVLDVVTGDAFLHLYREKKVANIAPYIMNVHVEDRYYANFADCSPTAGRAGVREYLYAKRVGNEDMMRWAAIDHKRDEDYLLTQQYNLFYRLQAAFTEAEIAAVDTAGPVAKPDLFYESVGLLIARDDRLFLAAKAGCNDDSHNHNDVGSITVYKDGKPLLIDVGVETYRRKTFSESRYEIWTMQSAYHNVLTFGDAMQLPGRECAAAGVSTGLGEKTVTMEMELAAAYPAGTVDSYRRSITFEKGKEIRVTDTLSSLPQGTFLTLMSVRKPVTSGNTISIGDLGTVELEGDCRVEIETISITDPKLLGEWGDTVYRTKIYPSGPKIGFTIQ